ncbi:hypothetical protein HYW40_00545 [Candidatus Curtissbacteria bacterium]|nr:hypothetical protein [Candidatus Curtissbacteria bacterium]
MRKGFVLQLVLGIAAVLVVGVVAAWYFLGQKNLIKINNKDLSDDRRVIVSEIDTSNWPVYSNEELDFSVNYPGNLKPSSESDQDRLGPNTSSRVYFSSGKPVIFWLNILENQEILSPIDFWASRYVFWDHAGETLEMSDQEIIAKATQYFDNAKIMDVGGNYEGYRMVVPDVLTRVEIFWFIDDKVFNFGYSPDDNSGGLPGVERNEIAEKILATFSIIN